jgi:hypothetical protein
VTGSSQVIPLAFVGNPGIMRQQAAPLESFAERCAMKDPTDFLKIKILGIEASAGGRFAIAALVLICLTVLVVRHLG